MFSPKRASRRPRKGAATAASVTRAFMKSGILPINPKVASARNSSARIRSVTSSLPPTRRKERLTGLPLLGDGYVSKGWLAASCWRSYSAAIVSTVRIKGG